MKPLLLPVRRTERLATGARAFLRILAATLIAACGATPEAEDTAEATGAPGPAAQAEPTFHETAPGPDHLVAMPGWDVGTGFVRIAPSPDGPPGSAPADTIVIRSEPASGASPMARAHHRSYRLVIEATEVGLQDGALEVGYEERALPILRTRDGWVEVSYAFADDGAQRTGWVDTRPPGLAVASWDHWLMDQAVPVFFRAADSIAFFDGPDGEPAEVTLAPGGGSRGADYILYPQRVEGEWMEVRIVSPSDYCSISSPSLEARGWIRYLTAAGRPRVWYSTRGC